MESANAVFNPPAQLDLADSSTPSVGKRKRDDSHDIETQSNGVHSNSNEGTVSKEDQELVRDLVDVLKSEDTTPSVLTRSIADRPSSTEPHTKRQKGEENSDAKTTILKRYISNTYKNVDEILQDIDTAVSDIKDMLHPRRASQNQHIPESEISLRVMAFKNRAHSLVRREIAARQKKLSKDGAAMSGFSTNGNAGVNAVKQIIANPDTNKTVLTLYGNAPGPRQLFSSLQIPTILDGDGRKVIQSLREAILPTGISTTQIIPAQATGLFTADKKRIETLGELFPAPSTLPVLQPPQPSKLATTRSNVVGWYTPSAKDTTPKGSGYSTQTIAAGQWLDYSKSAPPQDPKRRHRDRAMSLGGSKAPQIDPEPEETEAAKLDALFRSAYSGFAPTKDDSAAVASQGHMSRIWWQNVGERSFERLVESVESRVIENTSNFLEVAAPLEELDLKKLEEMADEMDQDTVDPSLVPLGSVIEKSAEEKEAEEVLADISELLQTLYSYQRNRHKSLNASARSGGLLSTTDASSVGTPSKPSEAEQATYEMLRTSLELMIQTLPPYAVAKLDPDRLAELSISTKIAVLREDYKGVMEEDEASARAKAALAAASSVARSTPSASVHRTNSSSQLYSGAQYSAPRPSGSQYYGNSQTPNRSTHNNLQRPPSTAPAPYQPRPVGVSSPSYRTSYGTPNYPHQSGARPAPTQYAGSSQQYQQSQNPQSYMRPQAQPQAYSQTPQAVSQASMNQGMNGGYPRQSFSHQNQTSQNGMNYQYNPANHPRQASPHKMYSPQPSVSQARPYGPPTPTPSAGPTRAPSYLQHSSPQPHQMPQPHSMSQAHSMSQNHSLPQTQINGNSSQTPQQLSYSRQTQGMNYSTFMTSQEQSNLLERQKAQLAQQQGFQQQARTAAQAALGSPSKPPMNGNYSVAAGQ